MEKRNERIHINQRVIPAASCRLGESVKPGKPVCFRRWVGGLFCGSPSAGAGSVSASLGCSGNPGAFSPTRRSLNALWVGGARGPGGRLRDTPTPLLPHPPLLLLLPPSSLPFLPHHPPPILCTTFPSFFYLHTLEHFSLVVFKEAHATDTLL